MRAGSNRIISETTLVSRTIISKTPEALGPILEAECLDPLLQEARSGDGSPPPNSAPRNDADSMQREGFLAPPPPWNGHAVPRAGAAWPSRGHRGYEW